MHIYIKNTIVQKHDLEKKVFKVHFYRKEQKLKEWNKHRLFCKAAET